MQILVNLEVFRSGTVNRSEIPIVNKTNQVHIYPGFIKAIAIHVLKKSPINTINKARKINPFFTISLEKPDFSAVINPFLYEIIPLTPETNKNPAAPTHEPIKIRKYHNHLLSGWIHQSIRCPPIM
jgi:hypothetical protein